MNIFVAINLQWLMSKQSFLILVRLMKKQEWQMLR